MQFLNFHNNTFSKKNNFKTRRVKLLICSSLLVSAFTIIGYRTISLASIDNNKPAQISIKQINSKMLDYTLRGNIFDRNNNLLATTVNISSLNINPQEVLDINQTILKLRTVFTTLNREKLLKKLNSNKKHVNLLREISP